MLRVRFWFIAVNEALIGLWCALRGHDARLRIEYGALVVRCHRCEERLRVFPEAA